MEECRQSIIRERVDRKYHGRATEIEVENQCSAICVSVSVTWLEEVCRVPVLLLLVNVLDVESLDWIQPIGIIRTLLINMANPQQTQNCV